MTIIQLKVCLLGDFAVGKTSLIRRFVEERFDDKYLSTIGVKVSQKNIEVNDNQIGLLIWDLAGSEDFVKNRQSYLRGASGALIVCDLTRKETISQLSLYEQQLHVLSSKAKIVVLGNKIDLIENRGNVIKGFEEAIISLGATSFVTSAKTGENVGEAFRLLSQMMRPK